MARRYASDDRERLTDKLTVQIAPGDRRRIEADAAASGAGLSEWVRERCLHRTAEPTMVYRARRNPAAKELADELRAIGNNLNQLARIANSTGDMPAERRLESVIERLLVTFDRVISL